MTCLDDRLAGPFSAPRKPGFVEMNVGKHPGVAYLEAVAAGF